MDPKDLLGKLTQRQDLSRDETRGLFDAIMSGGVEPTMLAALLSALATKGETVDEIVGAAEAMRSVVSPVRAPAGARVIDTCGTGGDGKPTFNVSSAVAIVSAAAGAVVAKHGNRSNARPSGSAEGLSALGINIDADVPTLERCLAECGVAFLYAPLLHPAMKHAGPVRKVLGVRTIFNILGPLTNPAGARRQLLGVNRPELVETMIEALSRLGAERAMVVCGLEGLCDLSVAGPTKVGRWDGEWATYEEVTPAAIGAGKSKVETLHVGGPQESAAVIERVLGGSREPAREMVVFNAAAALWVAGLVDGWSTGAALAREAIDSGAARRTLDRWRQVSMGQ